MPEVYLTITIDTECDKDSRWRIRRPVTFRGIHDGVGNRLQPLFDRYGAVPTYLLSPEVIADPGSAELFAALGPRAELGTHLHAEFIDPEPVPDASGTDLMQNSLSPEVERGKLERLTELFEGTFGHRPTSFRAGRFGVSERTLPVLSRLGYVVDSSIAPFQRWSDTGGTADFRRSPDVPYYYPSASDPLISGELPILEIPVTIVSSLLAAIPRSLRPGLMSTPLLGRRARRLLGTSAVPRWLRPWSSSGAEMIAVADEAIARWGRHDVVVLVMMFHNVEVVPGLSPYPQNEEQVERYLGSLATVLEHAAARGWHVTGLTEAALAARATLARPMVD